ncbi:unnamed protein product [Brassica oleracea]
MITICLQLALLLAHVLFRQRSCMLNNDLCIWYTGFSMNPTNCDFDLNSCSLQISCSELFKISS